MRRGINRRQFLRMSGGAVLSAAVASACRQTDVARETSGAGDGEVEAASSILWATNEAYSRPDMVDPFQEQSGIKVDLEIFSDVAEIVSKLKTGGSGIAGFLDGSYHAAESFDAGILEPIDLSNVPNYEAHLIPSFKDSKAHVFDGEVYGVPITWGTDSMAYNRDAVGGDLDDLSALWDPQFKGKIGMPKGLHESVIVAGIYAGVEDPFAMTSDELEEVKSLLIEQKPLVRTYWTEIGNLTNLFASGEVVVAWAWVPVLELRQKADIDMVWAVPSQGQLGWYDANFVSKEATPDQKIAFERFMNYTLGPYYGRVLADDIGYRTTSTAAIENIDPAMRKELDLDNPSAFLEGAHYWRPPNDPSAYEAVMNAVLNA